MNEDESKPLPSTIYKYFTLNQHFYDVIINAQLWFSSPMDFNDPFDCDLFSEKVYSEEDLEFFFKHIVKQNDKPLSKEMIEKNLQAWKEDPKKMEQTFINSMQNEVKSRGLCCFSEYKNSIIMWSHYANSHKGVCLGFGTEQLGFTQIDWVKYKEEFPDINWFRSVNESFVKVISNKSREWVHEGEIRILQKKKGNYPFKRKALNEIIFGARTSVEEMKTIKSLLDMTGYRHVITKKAVISKSKFELEFAKAILVYDKSRVGGDFDLPEGFEPQLK